MNELEEFIMQNEAVKSKLEYEYERFYMECICLSKAGIFSKSFEIELKKNVVKLLKKQLDDGETFSEEILVLDNILDDVYRYVADHQNEKAIEALVDEWKETVAKNH